MAQAERDDDRSRLILPGDPCPHETVFKHGDNIWRCRDCGEPVEAMNKRAGDSHDGAGA